MSPKYNAAIGIEELGSTKTYMRSKCASIGRSEGDGKAHHSFTI